MSITPPVTEEVDHEASVAAMPTSWWRPLIKPLILSAMLLWWAANMFGEDHAATAVDAAAVICTVCGLHLLIQWSGQVSLGHMAIVGIGGFATANLAVEQELPLPLALLLGGFCAMLATVAIGLPALRIRGFALAITTLAAATAVSAYLFRQDWLAGGSLGILVSNSNFFGFDSQEPTSFVVPALVVALIVMFITMKIGHSGVGNALRMVANDDEVAGSYGINVGTHKLAAFLFSGFVAGIGGGLMVLDLGRATPEMFPASESIVFVAAVLMGGAGSIRGPVIAAIALVAVPEFLDIGHYEELVGALGLLLAVRFVPEGINGQHEHMVERVASVKAKLRGASS